MNTKILIMIMFFIIIGEMIAQHLLKQHYQNIIFENLRKKDFDKVEELLNKKIIKFLFPPFNIEYCRLNEAFIKKDKSKIDEQFDILLKMRLNETQKQDLYLNGFNYYLSQNNKKRVEAFYKLAQELKNETVKNSMHISYDILCNNGYKYLDEVLKAYENCPIEEKYMNEILLSIMYKNKGDLEKANYYEKLAGEHLNETKPNKAVN